MMYFSPFLRQKILLTLENRSTLGFLGRGNFTKVNCLGLNSCIKVNYRFYSVEGGNKKSELAKSEGSAEVSTFHTVKEATKTVSYTGVILIGLGITSLLIYAVTRELFSSKSPNVVYSNALDRCLKNPKVIDGLGEPIKGYGETSSRGRRRHTSHFLYEKDNVNYLRMKFYIEGSRRKATVHLEMKENDKGKYEYRYLFIQMDDYPYSTIVLEDNRGQEVAVPLPSFLDSPTM